MAVKKEPICWAEEGGSGRERRERRRDRWRWVGGAIGMVRRFLGIEW